MSADGPGKGRVAPRYPIEAHLEFSSPSSTGRGRTRNISLSGAYIDAPPEVSPRDRIEVRFSFFVGSFEVAFPAEVVRLAENGFAVRFQDLGEPQLRILKRVLPN
jgi:hypothetical protein